MRIAILTWQYPPHRAGGTEFATQNLARHLVVRGHEVAVITTRDGGLPACSEDEGVIVHRVRSLSPKFLKYLWFCVCAVALVRTHSPDVVHAQALWSGTPACLCKLLLGNPYLVWLRGSDIYSPRVFRTLLERLVLCNADSVVVLTNHMRQQVAKVCRREVHVIPNGVNAESFQVPTREESRRELDVPESLPVVLFVGSLIPVKGVSYLIEAMPRVLAQRSDTLLLVVGGGRERGQLGALAESLGVASHVTFCGRVSHERISRYLAAADVFVLPSLSEGFPNVLLEAMATGIPVVASDVTGIREFLVDGESGFLVAAGDASAVAAAIVALLSDESLRERMGLTNLKKVLEYSWDNVVDHVLDVYRGIQAR